MPLFVSVDVEEEIDILKNHEIFVFLRTCSVGLRVLPANQIRQGKLP